MKLVRFLGLAVILAGISFVTFADEGTAAGNVVETRFVRVTKHLSTVYLSYQDPKPDQIIGLIRKGDQIELLRESVGGSWFEVRVEGKVGYLEAKNGKQVSGRGSSLMAVLFVLVLLCGATVVVLYMMKQRSGTVAANDLDDDDDLDDLDDD